MTTLEREPQAAPAELSPQPLTGMPLAEWSLRQTIQPFELINGRIVPLAPQKSLHAFTSEALFSALYEYLRSHPELGLKVFSETTYAKTLSSKWVTGSVQPDITIFDVEKLKSYRANTENWQDLPLDVIPILAIEVISVSERPRDILEKVGLYLNDGVPLVWLVYPLNKKIAVYRLDGDPFQVIENEGVLTGDPILPGFQLPVKELWF